MKYFYILILSSSVAVPLAAQQLAHWSQFRSFDYVVNPAAVDLFDPYGSWKTLDVDLAYRRQWTGFEGAPQTILAAAKYTNEDNHMSFGGFVANDQFGPTNYTQAQLFYSYQLQFHRYRKHGLSIGLGVSGSQFQLDGSKVKAEDLNDNLLSDAMQSRFFPNATAGLFYYLQVGSSRQNQKFLFGGLSVEQSFPGDLYFDGQGQQQGNLKRALHYHAYAGMRFYFDGGYGYAEPVVWAKQVFYAPTNVWTGIRVALFDQRLFTGAAVSSDWQAHLQVGAGLGENWQLHYSSSFFLASTFEAGVGLTHELVLSYQMGWD